MAMSKGETAVLIVGGLAAAYLAYQKWGKAPAQTGGTDGYNNQSPTAPTGQQNPSSGDNPFKEIEEGYDAAGNVASKVGDAITGAWNKVFG